MYTSYGGVKGRSKSSLDVSRSPEEGNEEPSYGSSTLSRYNRRRRAQAPAQIKRARSYLSDDIRRQFELGFERSTPGTVAPLPETPSSSNFVKRLVATLERKQRDDGSHYARPVPSNRYGAHYRQPRRPLLEEVEAMPASRSKQQQQRQQQQLDKKQIFLERFNTDLPLPRPVRRRQLEKVPERVNEGADVDENEYETVEEEEEEEEEEDDDDNDDGDEELKEEEEEKEYKEERANKTKRNVAGRGVGSEIIEIEPKYMREDCPGLGGEKSPPKASARRLLKSFLSTLANWRTGKTLPRGSRDYYAARESLGEEMRAFRRDTMPRLIERAVLVDRVRPSPSHESHEFAKLISAKLQPDDDPSYGHATIRPAYGSTAYSRQQQQQHQQQQQQQRRTASYQDWMTPVDESIYGSRRIVKPPAAPRRVTLSRPSEETLRPPKPQDLEMYRESVQLRRQTPSHNQMPVILYDVPRSNRRVASSYVTERSRRTSPEYENIGNVISDDKRLHCTTFTTF